MKTFKLFSYLLFISVILISCGSVKVASDFDSEADFSQYKTFAFYKSGIDKVEISDIDKKRILKSIQNTLLNKGCSKFKLLIFNPNNELSFSDKEFRPKEDRDIL